MTGQCWRNSILCKISLKQVTDLRARETQERGKGFSNALFFFYSSRRYSSPGRSTRKQRQADDRGDEVRDLTSKSSSEYRTLFLWKRRGAGGEKKASMTTPRPPQNSLDLSVFVDLSVPLFSNKRTANIHRLPNMIQTFIYKCHGKKRQIVQPIST